MEIPSSVPQTEVQGCTALPGPLAASPRHSHVSRRDRAALGELFFCRAKP